VASGDTVTLSPSELQKFSSFLMQGGVRPSPARDGDDRCQLKRRSCSGAPVWHNLPRLECVSADQDGRLIFSSVGVRCRSHSPSFRLRGCAISAFGECQRSESVLLAFRERNVPHERGIGCVEQAHPMFALMRRPQLMIRPEDQVGTPPEELPLRAFFANVLPAGRRDEIIC